MTKCMEKKINTIVENILDEDQENDFGVTRAETCPEDCGELDNTSKEESHAQRTLRQCKCGVENSSRFSLRVMEAMRSLQRDVSQPSTSSAEEIADYIRSHYRYDGDLYAQVRTALRQVCSQGFVMELLSNEYHLVGPIASQTKRNGCSLDCTGRMIDDTSRRRKIVNDRRNGARFLNSRQGSRVSRAEFLRTSIIDRPEDLEPVFHSTDIVDERDNADHRDIVGMERDAYAEPIPGPSRGFLRAPSPVPARNMKKARIEDRGAQRADEKDDDDTTTEEDMDCTCAVTRDEHSRIQPLDRPRVIRNQRNERRRNDAEEDEEDVRERMEEEDEDAEEDSAYEELRARVPRRRTATRKRELKRWIRRCRRECERRGRRGR